PIGILFCFHLFPFHELLKPHPSLFIKEFFHFKNLSVSVKRFIHYVALSLIPKISRKYVIYKRRIPYQYADKIVFLSKKYISSYAAGLAVKVDDKFCAIPNSLTFDFMLDPADLSKKEKEVLLVARLDEESKKISKALEIWKKIEENGNFPDWKLTIVGAGPDEEYFKKLAVKLALKSVFFEGRQKPLAYYQRTSLFMMTSAYEGLPMTLLEAQQMGTVPIAFNSFDSLSDIIEDGYNGIIIPNHELELFTEKLMWLMNNKEEREKMALNGLQSCQRFSIENVTHEWINLFESLARK
ncbi:MAG: glycosyltransferase, partial [Bacteroidales bacterium]